MGIGSSPIVLPPHHPFPQLSLLRITILHFFTLTFSFHGAPVNMVGSINEKQLAASDNKQVIETPDAPLSTTGSNSQDDTKAPHHVSANGVSNEKDLDKAYLYMKGHEGEGAEEVGVDLVKLRRKIDWRIVPIMLAAYTMQFVDKVMINVSATAEYDEKDEEDWEGGEKDQRLIENTVRCRHGYHQRPQTRRQQLLQRRLRLLHRLPYC